MELALAGSVVASGLMAPWLEITPRRFLHIFPALEVENRLACVVWSMPRRSEQYRITFEAAKFTSKSIKGTIFVNEDYNVE